MQCVAQNRPRTKRRHFTENRNFDVFIAQLCTLISCADSPAFVVMLKKTQLMYVQKHEPSEFCYFLWR